MELSNVQLQILQLASNIAATGYTPENKGYLEIREKNTTTLTPINIKNIYYELVDLFKDE